MGEELSILLQVLEDAGVGVRNLKRSNDFVSTKGNNELLTKADLLINDILRTRLSQHFPNDGWLSEETVDDKARLHQQRVWIVDPIDGTKEFISEIPEYAISVALIENGEPILSAVYNPATGEFFHAIKGAGAWLQKQRLHCRIGNSVRLQLLASRSEYARGEWEKFKHNHDVKPIGSIAYKLALIAAGAGDATFSLGPKNEWDIAAGVLIVQEAGGIVTDKTGKPFVFNQENVLVNGIIATSAQANEQVLALCQV